MNFEREEYLEALRSEEGGQQKNEEDDILKRRERERDEERSVIVEERIRSWADFFYETLKKYFARSGKKELQSLEELSPKKLSELLSSFPLDLVEAQNGLRYILTKIVYQLGKRGNRDKGRPVEWTSENENVVVELIARVLKIPPSKARNTMDSNPVFSRDDKWGRREINIDEDVKKYLPPQFFENPMEFIERKLSVERDVSEVHPEMGIRGLFDWPYDWTRVKRWKGVIFKRVDLSKVNYGTEEIDEAAKVNEILNEVHDSRVQVQKFFGFVYDKGNIYLVSEFVPASQNLYDYKKEHRLGFELSIIPGEDQQKFDLLIKKVKRLAKNIHRDLEDRNIIVQLKEGETVLDIESLKKLVIIDFETKPNNK